MLLYRKVTGAPAAALALGARERPLDHLSPVTITEWLRRATVDATGSAAWRSSRPSSMLRLASAGSPPIAGRLRPRNRNSRAWPALSRTMKQALLFSSSVQGRGKRRGEIKSADSLAVCRFKPDDDACSLPNLNVKAVEQRIGNFDGFVIRSAFDLFGRLCYRVAVRQCVDAKFRHAALPISGGSATGLSATGRLALEPLPVIVTIWG
jgi:hypothetical protein